MTITTERLDEHTVSEGVPSPLPHNVSFSTEFSLHEVVTNIVVFSGLKGSTKTCQLARYGLMGLALWDMPVFSDFPLAGNICGEYYEAQPLPPEALVNYAHNLPQNSMLLIDELQEWFDRQDWSSVKSRLGVSMSMQIRKLNLMIVGAIQFWSYLNPRLNDQVDILIRCQDYFFTPWGKEVQIAKGTEAHLEYFDLSGSVTGQSARNPMNPRMIMGDAFAEEDVYTKALWEYFDTRKLTAIEQRFMRWEIEKEVRKIDPTAGYGGRKATGDELKHAVMVHVDHLRTAGINQIDASALNQQLVDKGINLGANRTGQIMTALGVPKHYTRRGTIYTLKEEMEGA